MIKKVFCSILLMIIMILVLTCDAEPDVEIFTDRWIVDDNSYLKLSTNDEAHCGHYFHAWREVATYSVNSLSAIVNRKSGSNNHGYGITFGHQDINNYYRILISLKGNFIFYKKVDGVVTNLIPWSNGSGLLEGLNKSNEIEIDKTSGSFKILFNGVDSGYTISDNSFTTGHIGFITNIGDQGDENFPNVPNDTRFKFTNPDIPSTSF